MDAERFYWIFVVLNQEQSSETRKKQKIENQTTTTTTNIESVALDEHGRRVTYRCLQLVGWFDGRRSHAVCVATKKHDNSIQTNGFHLSNRLIFDCIDEQEKNAPTRRRGEKKFNAKKFTKWEMGDGKWMPSII